MEHESYKTRKEYRWAKKNESRAHARSSAYWRYPASAAFVLGLVFLHGSFVIALAVGSGVALLCVCIKHSKFSYTKPRS
jgi:hypothetical protein